jgi:hypothetical protein
MLAVKRDREIQQGLVTELLKYSSHNSLNHYVHIQDELLHQQEQGSM